VPSGPGEYRWLGKVFPQAGDFEQPLL